MDGDTGRQHSADNRGTTSASPSLPMRWLAAGIPLTLLIDLVEPDRSTEIALHEAVHEARHIRLYHAPTDQRFLLSKRS